MGRMNFRTKLARKLEKTPAAILNDAEVKAVVAEARRVFGESLIRGHDHRAVRFEDQVRWNSLRARCLQARAEQGWEIKDVARSAKIPRYRIEAIEGSRLREVRPELAWPYFEMLGIASWVKRWVRSNPETAKRAGITLGSS